MVKLAADDQGSQPPSVATLLCNIQLLIGHVSNARIVTAPPLAGYDNAACSKCGEGLTTSRVRSVRPTDCIALPGWQKQNPSDAYAEPCAVGSYSQGGDDSCRKCPLGSSTQYTSSYTVSQCTVCAPGWGGSYNTSESNCTICSPGSFSPGGSDEPCTACGAGQTSAVGATSRGDCFDQFLSTAPYDFIDTPASAWTRFSMEVSSNVSTDAASCRTGCRDLELCEYWLYKADQADPGRNGCFLKLAAATPAEDTYTAIKLSTGDYTIWPVSARGPCCTPQVQRNKRHRYYIMPAQAGASSCFCSSGVKGVHCWCIMYTSTEQLVVCLLQSYLPSSLPDTQLQAP